MDYDKFYHTFQDLFEHHSIVIDDEELKKYARSWHQLAVYKDLSHYDQGASEHEKEFINVVPIFEPRGAQIEALYALEENRKEGATRALVQAATGMGKTYLAAFFSKSYSRVLFVAHRQEILAQAARDMRLLSETSSGTFSKMLLLRGITETSSPTGPWTITEDGTWRAMKIRSFSLRNLLTSLY